MIRDTSSTMSGFQASAGTTSRATHTPRRPLRPIEIWLLQCLRTSYLRHHVSFYVCWYCPGMERSQQVWQ